MPNKSMTRLLFVVACFWLSSGNAQGLPPLTHQLTAITPEASPPLKLKNMDDEIIDLATLRGKAVVVNFWATWCPPCRREMGSMERLYQATREQGVEVLAVNIGEDVDTVFSFMGTVEPSPSFQILMDTNGETTDLWKVKGLPTTYIIDANGKLAYKAVGGREFDHPEIEKALLALTR